MTIRELLDAFSRCTSHGWLTWDEALLLVDTAGQTTGGIVEVGSYRGRSACLLAQLRDRQGIYRQVNCIDPWDDHFSSNETGEVIFGKFQENIRGLEIILPGVDVRVFRKKVEEMPPFPAGFVYLDGDHSYEGTLRQCQFASGCQPRAIAVHDVDEQNVVAQAAVEALGPWSEKVRTLAVWRLKR